MQALVELSAVRFQYRGQPNRRGNWENLPFYLRYLRQFLEENDGDAVWLKGNTGGDEAAYLIFNSNLREEIAELMSRPLAELGSYEISAESEPIGVLRKHYRDGKIGVGRLTFWEEQVGEAIDALMRKFNEGFWLAPIDTPSGAVWLKARSYKIAFHEGETWFCLTDVEERICRSDGTLVHVKHYPELWIRAEALSK